MTNYWMLLFAPLRLVTLSMEDLPHQSFCGGVGTAEVGLR